MIEAKDIWFRTDRSLDAIADALRLSDVAFDGENYWEWVIGDWGAERIQLDVTRTHASPPQSTETRVFRLDLQPFSDVQVEQLCQQLLPIVNADIKWGEWRHRSGVDFDLVELGRSS